MTNADLRREFFADAIQAYLDRTDDGKLSPIEKFDCKAKYEEIKASPYVLYILPQLSGDDPTIYKLINKYTTDYNEEIGMVTINSRQITTLYRRGLDFSVQHEVDVRGGMMTLGLPVGNLRPCDEKEASLFFKCFDKIEQTIDTDLSWCLN